MTSPVKSQKELDARIVVAIDGTSASGKSTNARLVSRALGFLYVDTGAMYRTLAWKCLHDRIDISDEKAVSGLIRKWKTALESKDGQVRLLVDGYFPEKEIRTAETSQAVPSVAAMPKVRDWMKLKQRECLRLGNLVMEGRDIGSNVFPETEFKFYLDATLSERTRRREADGVREDLALRDRRDSSRAAAPLMIPLGAVVINTSGMTPNDSSAQIIESVRRRLDGAAGR